MHALTCDSLTKVYTDVVNRKLSVVALKDVSLEVEQGTIFGLLGPNGAGKTTFVKILLGLVRATSGRAMMLGQQLPHVGVRQRIGYLPESHRYPGYLDASQVIMLFGRLSTLDRAILLSRTASLLTLVGLDRWKNMRVKRYSKGMLQRLGLAQALINDPDLVFLDEPTDGVDPIGRKEIRDVLLRLRNEGKTIFLNSHLLSEVEMICDRVAILDRGKLLKVGSVDELTTTDTNYELGFEGTLPQDFYHEAAATVLKFRVDKNLISADVRDIGELNHLIDLLRRHGVGITHVVRKRSTLEDSFLRLLKREVIQ